MPSSIRDEREPSMVLPWLFLGCDSMAWREVALKERGITHVLRCISGPAEDDDKTRCVIPLSDFGNSPLVDRLKEATEFLDRVQDQNGKALVHCSAGINRSPAMVVGYLMMSLRTRMTLKDAYETVHRARPQVCIHDGYVHQLRQFDNEIHGKHSTTEVEIMTTSAAVSAFRRTL